VVVTGGLRDAYPNPYFFCVQGVVSLIARSYIDEAAKLNDRPHARVAFVLDRQGVLEDRMAEQYRHVERTVHPHIASTMGSLEFRDDRDCLPLQAADLIAYHARRDFVQPAKDGGVQRPEIIALRGNTRGEIAIWNSHKLKSFVDEIDARGRTPDFWQ
jgi:hypothetical protein